MNKLKIFNDPIYGLISFPYEILYDLIEHPYFQRLRRISQTGLTQLVYPGATHTRFHHALGACHLMTRALDTLKQKGAVISEQEAEAVCIAILLHDIGHGPYSHALEGKIVPLDHEALSLRFMHVLNKTFDGKLSLAIEIFAGRYHRPLFKQLVSSNLDMDRMDYLTRDSFYTGVIEGKVGYDRIIAMMRVHNDQLVIEEKGIFSIEKFLISRTFMYWQVYLHKAVLSAEKMLVGFFERYKTLYLTGNLESHYDDLLLSKIVNKADNQDVNNGLLNLFAELDDIDLMALLKKCQNSSDFQLRVLSKGLVLRKLHKTTISDEPISDKEKNAMISSFQKSLSIFENDVKNLVFKGAEKTTYYSEQTEDINVLFRDGSVKPIHSVLSLKNHENVTIKYYLCVPNRKLLEQEVKKLFN